MYEQVLSSRMTDDEQATESDRWIHKHTTGEDRVRMVARQLSEPRTVNWIANTADRSHGPTKRVLDRLVAEGSLRKDTDGSHDTYYPDYRQQAVKEAVRLRDSDLSAEELTEKISEMKDTMREWREEFNVESPNQLRATIATEDVDKDEEHSRRDIAREWEHLQRRVEIAGFAIREWDFFAPSSQTAKAGRNVC
jgi:polyhydroxyalkanoate synthesis regulator phasin